MAVTFGNLSMLVGSLVSSDADGSGTDVGRVMVEFESRTGVGDSLFALDSVNGVLTELYITPDPGSAAPTSGWDLVITDEHGNPVYSNTNITGAVDTTLTKAIAGNLRFNALNMGDAKRAKVTLVFTPPEA